MVTATRNYAFTDRPRVDRRTTLADLLEQSGFRIKGRRADCIHCEGHARLTVAFNDEVALCHRCHWTGNIRTLSRALDLPLAPITRQVIERRHHQEQFKEWLWTCHETLARVWRELTLQSELAKQILARWPEEELAWDVLSDFYHSQADFGSAFEFLSCEKLPEYLEVPITHDKLFAAFEEAAARVKDPDAA